jgi:hypothetical protein
MALRGSLRILASIGVALPLVAGCAGISYRDRSTLSHTRYATIENFGDEEITAEQVDGLLEEVAGILDVKLDPTKPKVRIMVRSVAEIRELRRGYAGTAAHWSETRALYFAGANLVVIPYYSRTVLGHELAHYLTDHYLKSTPRRLWERIALDVEDALPHSAPASRSPSDPRGMAARVGGAPVVGGAH